MDYGEILTRAWAIMRKHRILWLFGILVSCGQGGGGGGGGGGGNTGFQFSGGDIDRLPPQMRDFMRAMENFFNNVEPWQIMALVAGFILLGLILFFLFQALHTVGRLGMIQGTVGAEAGAERLTFGELFNSGKPFFWRIFWFDILATLAVVILVLVILIPLIGLTVLTLGLGLVILLPFICLLVPAGWLYGLVIEQGNIAIVLEDLNLVDGFKRGWQVFRENFISILVMALLLLVIAIVVGIVIALPIIVIVVPAAIGVAAGIARDSGPILGTGLIVAGLCFVVYLPVLILLNGILQGYLKSAWTLTFMRLTGAGGVVAAVEMVEDEEPPELAEGEPSELEEEDTEE